jgi:pimeloyl-ACP methyl ester carboxylesterase
LYATETDSAPPFTIFPKPAGRLILPNLNHRPGDEGMPFAQVGDLRVAYDDAGTGSPVLMINGIGAPRGAWFLQAPEIAQLFRTITFDNRDVGETGPSPTPDQYDMRRFADDAAGLLDALGIERAHVVGASMGGCIAQEMAISHPERVVSVTIVCSWATVEPWLRELWEQWEAIFAEQGPLAWSRTTWLWVFTHRWYREPANLAGLLASAAKDPLSQTLEMYLRQSHAAKTFEALQRLPGISSPAHVVAGEEDIFTPPRYSQAIAAAIPRAKLSIMPNTGHGMFWEATASFNRLVIDFLRETDG